MDIFHLKTRLVFITIIFLLIGCGKIVNTATNLDQLVGRENLIKTGENDSVMTSQEVAKLQRICDKLAYKRLFLNNTQRRFNTSISALSCTASSPVQEMPVLALSEVNSVAQFSVVSNGPSSFFFSKYETDQQGLMKKYCEMLTQDNKSKVVNVASNDQFITILNFTTGDCEAVGSSLNGNLTCLTIEEGLKVRESIYRTIRAHKFYVVSGENATFRGFLAKRDYSEECTDPARKLSIQSTTTSID
jgi:hypothetical protein